MIWESASVEVLLSSGQGLRVPNKEESSKARWRSIRILYLTQFISSIGYSIIITSIWPFLKMLNPDISTTFLGVAIGIYSLGQFISSPVLGWLSNRFSFASAMCVGLSLQLLGNLLMAYLQDLPSGEYFLLASRFIIGVGAGSSACIRAYLSQATTLEERTGAAGEYNISRALGFSLGPAVQAVCVFAKYPGPVEMIGFHFNMFTSPAWISIGIIIINMLIIKFLFHEYQIQDDAEVPILVADDDEVVEEVDDKQQIVKIVGEEDGRIDIHVLLMLLFYNFIANATYITFETVTTPLTVFELGWSKSFAMIVAGAIWTGVGILIIGIVFFLVWLTKRIGERKLLAIGYVCSLAAFVVCLPIYGPKPPIKWVNSTTISSADDAGGCPSILSWCFVYPRISIYQFLAAVILLSFGNTFNNVLCYSLFSKVLGNVSQGLWMGIYTALGSLARLIVPIFVGAMLNYYGPMITFASDAIFAFPGLLWMFYLYKRIVPAEKTR